MHDRRGGGYIGPDRYTRRPTVLSRSWITSAQPHKEHWVVLFFWGHLISPNEIVKFNSPFLYNWLYNVMYRLWGRGDASNGLPPAGKAISPSRYGSYTWNDHESQKKFLAEKQGGLLGGRERERHIGKDLRLSAISSWAPGRNKKYIVRAETRIVMFPSIQLGTTVVWRIFIGRVKRGSDAGFIQYRMDNITPPPPSLLCSVGCA